MKRLIYKSLVVFIIAFMVSCKSESRKNINENSMVTEDVDLEIDIADEKSYISEAIIEKSNFKYQELSTEKLQEFFDLIALQDSHPEFNESIQSQLQNYTDDALSNYKTLDDALIKNLELKGDIISVSDRLKKMKLIFNVVSNNTIKEDSIWAEITLKNSVIEGVNRTFTKIKFRKIK